MVNGEKAKRNRKTNTNCVEDQCTKSKKSTKGSGLEREMLLYCNMISHNENENTFLSIMLCLIFCLVCDCNSIYSSLLQINLCGVKLSKQGLIWVHYPSQMHHLSPKASKETRVTNFPIKSWQVALYTNLFLQSSIKCFVAKIIVSSILQKIVSLPYNTTFNTNLPR